MITYSVISKATGLVVYGYTAAEPIEWSLYPFSDFDHVVVPEVFVPPLNTGDRHLTKLQFRKRLYPAEESAMDKIRDQYMLMPFSDAQKDAIRVINNKYTEATFIDLDDQDNLTGLEFFAALGALAHAGRPQEILA